MDAYDLGVNDKGIHRVLRSLLPVLLSRDLPMAIATTDTGAAHLRDISEGSAVADVIVVPRMKKSVWEQWGLPRTAARNGIAATYSHREAGALWGPPLVLHVPEDPEVRWAREPAGGAIGRARRLYSRALMGRSLRRAAVVVASAPSVAAQLVGRYGVPHVRTIPLGVDAEQFCPAVKPREDCVFHLGSPDPRDRTPLVVSAYGAARGDVSLPPLLIGGSLGEAVGSETAAEISRLGLGESVGLLGRMTDDDLATRYRHALVVVQPSSDEGFGLQPLEALASGAPLVVADAAAVRDVIGRAALVAGERTSLADGIVRLASDRALRDSFRRAGPFVAAKFTWRDTADGVLAALERAWNDG